MAGNKNIQTRNELKEYFETGDYPTEDQFGGLIDSYAHLNEFNFGISVRPSGKTASKFYHFYIAKDPKNSGRGHMITEAALGSEPEIIEGYSHIYSRNIFYKCLTIKVIGGIDIGEYCTKVVLECYKQVKKMPSDYIRPSGYYKEDTSEAERNKRKSEYFLDKNETTIDIEPIRYFRPGKTFKDSLPSGSLPRKGSYRYSKVHNKPFVVAQLVPEICINSVTYRLRPIKFKIILGSSGEEDVTNFLFD